MFAIVAAILFAVALLLELLDTGTEIIAVLTLGGFLALALHFVVPLPWRREAGRGPLQ
jgi:hypothetical protein